MSNKQKEAVSNELPKKFNKKIKKIIVKNKTTQKVASQNLSLSSSNKKDLNLKNNFSDIFQKTDNKDFLISKIEKENKKEKDEDFLKNEKEYQEGRTIIESIENNKNKPEERSLLIYKKLAYIFTFFVLISISVVIYFTISKVDIIIIPSKEKINDSLIFDVKNISEKNESDEFLRGIKGDIREINVIVTRQFEAGDSEIIGEEAVGKVIIYNNYSKNQPLVASTRLLTVDGKLFRLKNTINVPAGESVEAEIYADKPSVDMAIKPTRFVIPGLWVGLQDKIFAENKEPIIYRKQTKKKIAKNDTEKAITILKEDIITKAKSEVEKNSEYDKIVFKLNEEYASSSIDAKPDEEKDYFTASLEGKVIAIFFNEDDVKKIIKEKISLSLPETKELYSLSNSILYNLNFYEIQTKQASIIASYEGEIIIKANSVIIDKNKIVGLNEDQLTAYLKTFSEIYTFDIRFTPSFIKRVPNLLDRINIIIKR